VTHPLAAAQLRRGERDVRVNGGRVVYELLGTRGDVIVLTPGGRFGKDVPGLRPLAQRLVDGGYRVLLWDRPNCGGSDVQFFGPSESHMRAATLRALINELDIGPCVLAGGSGGARDSMLTAILHPEVVQKLILWNIVGGIYGSFVLGSLYVLPSIRAARKGGMKAVAQLPEWEACIERNCINRERFLAMDENDFLRTTMRWLNAYVSKPGQTIPGVEDEAFEDIRVPTLIIRNGENDWDHPMRTSFEIGCLIRGSTLIDPPWPEDAWEQAARAAAAGEVEGFHMFDTWVQAAPAIIEFLGES
jgi:pimeloyl-ACP methyl ester carboxylesterase